jgi:ABC-type lipoprotein release transport system permease subunit
LLLGIAINHVARGLVFGIGVFDPWTIVVTLLGFLGLVLLASWIPTARAGRVNALAILKND